MNIKGGQDILREDLFCTKKIDLIIFDQQKDKNSYHAPEKTNKHGRYYRAADTKALFR